MNGRIDKRSDREIWNNYSSHFVIRDQHLFFTKFCFEKRHFIGSEKCPCTVYLHISQEFIYSRAVLWLRNFSHVQVTRRLFYGSSEKQFDPPPQKKKLLFARKHRRNVILLFKVQLPAAPNSKYFAKSIKDLWSVNYFRQANGTVYIGVLAILWLMVVKWLAAQQAKKKQQKTSYCIDTHNKHCINLIATVYVNQRMFNSVAYSLLIVCFLLLYLQNQKLLRYRLVSASLTVATVRLHSILSSVR